MDKAEQLAAAFGVSLVGLLGTEVGTHFRQVMFGTHGGHSAHALRSRVMRTSQMASRGSVRVISIAVTNSQPSSL